MCEALGLARSNVHALKRRPCAWIDGRTGRTPRGDSELLAEICHQIAELPSYGYRRACALVNQQRPAGAPPVNPKRAYRVMAGNGLLLPKAPTRPHSSRPHNGTVAVATSDTRWCSDGFEIKCDSGQTVTATFAKDGGHPGDRPPHVPGASLRLHDRREGHRRNRRAAVAGRPRPADAPPVDSVKQRGGSH